jgi:endonuclease/exonuclease/phosphatase family metal-dependent hydrolase
MKILSCNIRYSQAQDGENRWELRKRLCADVIARQRADIVCFLEMTVEQLSYLGEALPGYAVATALDRPGTGEPVVAIFYSGAAFAPRAAGAYWLSETPHVSGSRSWKSDCVRMACWVQLERRDGRADIRIVNTHLDHVSQEARENQARLINEDAAAYPPGFPQILTGDMNAGPSNPAIAAFLRSGWADTYAATHGALDPGPTFHGFRGEAWSGEPGKIDWIFARGRIRATGAEIIREGEGGRYPSDHYFLSAVLE